MPRQRVQDVQYSFLGGLNTVADESMLRPDELQTAENAKLTERGALLKRKGTQRVHAAAIGGGAVVRGGYYWSTASTPQLLAVSNGQLHTGTYAIPMTWTARGSAGDFVSTFYPTFAQFYDGSADVAYIADGGALNKWNGTVLSLNIASTPNVGIIAVHNSRLFGAGDITNPRRLYYSGLNNGDTLGIAASGGGAVDIHTGGSEAIKGLVAVGNSLLIFHESSISRFTGWSQDDFDIDAGTRGVASDVGTIATHSIVAVENMAFFLSDRGFYAATEAGVISISDSIDNVVSSISQATFNRAVAGHNKADREVWFYLPDVGIYVFNYRARSEAHPYGAWTGPFTGGYLTEQVNSLWGAVDTVSKPILLYGGDDGFVRLCEAGFYKDDVLSGGTGGTNITLSAKLRRFGIVDEFATKAWRYAYCVLDAKGSTTAGITWSATFNSGSSTWPRLAANADSWNGTTWGGGVWGAGSSKPYRVHMPARGSYVDLTITDDSDSGVVYSRVGIEGFYYGRRF